MTANLDSLTHKNCLIVGIGDTGLSCARFLSSRAMSVAMLDTREQPPALGEVQQACPQVLIKTGKLDQEWMLNADLVILSPGVDPRLAEIQLVKQAGIEVIGDIELFARYANAPIVAITGSNGKSTVTCLISLMAHLAGKQVKTGGNLGTPALNLLTETAPDFYILELSSFQLETVQTLNAFASAVLNVSPDHLDRYDSLDDYKQAKQKIFNGDGVMVINDDDFAVKQMAQAERNQISFSLHKMNGVDFGVIEKAGKTWLSEGDYPLMPVEQMKLVGTHNVANALAALALGSAMALPMKAMLDALKEFKGLPHRCRLVREMQGVRWFNDSKATNVGATLAAIEGLSGQGHIILIAGGVGKDQDFSALTAAIKSSVIAVVLIGEAAQQIAAVIPDGIEKIHAESMLEAVIEANNQAKPNTNVLLSPACASFDMFSSYTDRGDQFEVAVRSLKS